MRLIPATVEHARFVAATLRQTDIDEMRAVGVDPLDAPVVSLRESLPELSWAWVDTDVDRPLAIGGCAHLNEDVGVAWMLTSTELDKTSNPRGFVDLCRESMSRMHQRYPMVFNWIDERNVRSLRWLTSIGFFPTVTDPNYAGSGLPFTCYVSLRHV